MAALELVAVALVPPAPLLAASAAPVFGASMLLLAAPPVPDFA
jgi:hypothetical protein